VCERWLNFERLLIAPTLPDEARGSLKIDADEGEGARPKVKRANVKLGEGVAPATIWGRARRARLKAASGS
jgi:hypothetical protein